MSVQSSRDAGAALDNVNVAAVLPLPSPAALRREMPADAAAVATVAGARAAITDIIEGRDPRLVLVVGPCSIHDPAAARDYLARLTPLAAAVSDVLLVVMRVYFEKPRTTVGWKGLVNDPRLDDSFDLEGGLRLARQLLLDLADAGMPAATEALDPIVPQYLGDLVSWYAIGARTTESQTHREMASGLSAPCGFKNGTDGEVTVAVQAMQSAATPHAFLGIDGDGRPSVIRTRGNRETHVILRGGAQPNYDEGSVSACVEALARHGLREAVMVDASHGNTGKDHARQPAVAREVVRQRAAGNRALMGLMLESNLNAGKQPFGPPAELAYGVSVTDACIDFETTEALVCELAATLRGSATRS
ncbi:MAG: 3-deoxy-7-phosphoheptulonate synthase [Gammaproteobacteria bacterium]